MAGYIELATLKAPVVADQKAFKQGMEQVKKQGKSVANEVEKQFAQASKQVSNAWDIAAKKIQKGLKTTEAETKELTKSAQNIYKEGFGKSVNDVVRGLMQTKRALGDLDSESIETATKRALELRDTMGVKMSRTLKMAKQEMRMYGSTADEAFDRVEKRLDQNAEAWEKLGTKGEKLSTIGTALTAGLTVPLVGLTTASVKMASDFESANARIVGSLGLTEKQSGATKTALEKIYSDGFGENMEDVADAIVQVKQQLSNIPDDQIVKVTENALVLRDTLGQDMNESLRGVNSLMVNFGMSADDAMDLYVTGVQSGLDKTGELGDNLAEYGQLWSQAGFSAKDMFSVLENGLKSGAYNLDKVNDFVKEFTISLNDGRIEDNLSRFSEGTQNIFQEFKEGKKTAQDVFQSVIHDLENTKNQQEKLTLASTVWSALGEDNAMKIIESLNDVNHTYDDVSGSMEKVKDQQNETFGARAKSLFREAQTALLPLGEVLLKLGEKYLPKVESATKKFADTLENMSDEDIERVLKIGGFVAIAGPTVVAIGKVTSGISKLGDILKLTSGGATLAESAIGGFLKSGALLNPWVLGAAGTITIGAVAWKAWGEKAVESAERTRKWGTSVSEEAGKTLNKVQEFSTQSGLALDNFENKAKDNAKNVAKAFEDMQKTINQTVDEVNKKNKELIDNLPEELQKGAQKRADKIAETNQKLTESTQAMSNQVSAIYQKHNGDVSKFTDEEKQIIMNNRQSMMQAEVNLLFESGKKKQAIMKALNSDINSMSLQMAGEYSQSVIKAIEKSNKTYDDDVSNLKKSLKAGLITRKEYNSKTKQLTDEHEQMMQSYAEKLVQYYKKMYPNDTYKIVDELQKLGINYGDVVEKMGKHTDKAIAKNKLFAETTKKSSNEAIIANKVWNDMVFDEKTGKVKTNLKEVIASATDSEEAWQNLEFILKHANLTSNAKTEIAVAMGEAGKWNQLSVEQKQVIVNGDQSKLIMYDNINALGAWNSYEADVKKLGVDNADVAYKMFQSQDQVNQWNELPVNVKMMYANNADLLNKALQSGQALNDFAQNNPETKKLLGDSSSVVKESGKGQKGLENYKQAATTIGSTTLLAIDKASGPAQEATRNVRGFGGNETITKTFKVVANIAGAAAKLLGFAKGSDGLPNDQLAVVNDQEGPIYEEMIIPPKGPAFIPEGRNVMLPLKKGTKIKTAYETRKIKNNLPHYARGTGENLPFNGYNARFIESSNVDNNPDTVLYAIKKLIEKEKVIVVQANNREIARGTWSYAKDFANEYDLMKSKIRG
nr:MAG TPA: minor tail protein [Caudoviricetes sp.]